MITGYFKFEKLPDDIKATFKIRSKARLDCTFYAGQYKGLTNLVNQKGMLFFFLTAARDFVQADSKRIADYSLTNGSINLTSLYIEDLDYSQFADGTPNAKRFLANGEGNPLFQFRNDGYLFEVNADYTLIEMFVIKDGRNLISAYYQKLIDGGLDDEINLSREAAKPFFDYGKCL